MHIPGKGEVYRHSPPGWVLYALSLFLLVYALLLTSDLGHKSLVWDEAVIAQSGIDIARLSPSLWSNPQETINTYVRWFPYFPPFMSMVLAAAYSVFGVSEVVARLVSVSFSLLGLITTFLLGREAFDDSTGLAASLLLSVMPIYWHMSRVAMLDVASVFFYTLTLYLYYRGVNTRRRELILLSGFALGLGVLTKYPNILCVPVLLASFALETYRDDAVDWRSLISLLLALEAAFFIVVPWFYKTTTISQSWTGWVNEIKPGKQYKWLMAEYWIGSLGVLPLQTTTVIAVLALLAVIYSLKQGSKADFFLLVWVAVIFLWFVPIHKDLRYTLPYLPALAILSGRLLQDFSRRVCSQVSERAGGLDRGRPRLTALVTLILVLLFISPVLYGLTTRPKDLRVPIHESFVSVARNLEAGRNVLILLSCNNFSQHAAYFYMYMVSGLDASVHILTYPSNSVDWYDPGPINTTRIDQLCLEGDVQYVLLWDGSPYSDSWLPVLLGHDPLALEEIVGSRGNAIYILEFQSRRLNEVAGNR